MCGQLNLRYIPYCHAKITGNTAYRFPEYFYRRICGLLYWVVVSGDFGWIRFALGHNLFAWVKQVLVRVCISVILNSLRLGVT